MLREKWRSSKTFIVLLIVLITVFLLFFDCRISGGYFALYSGKSSSFENRLEGPLMAEDPQLVSYLYTNILKPPSTKPYNFTFHLPYNKEIPFLRLSSKLHKFIYFTFKDITYQGFFIEAGALDGEAGSNSLYLEYKKNWTGLLIEPDPTSCKVLETRHRKAWTSCSCISPKNYAVKSVFEIPHTIDKSSHQYWLFQSNVRSINSRFHTYKDIIMNTVKHKKGSFSYSSFQCFPLITYLLALNVSVVDLLSLDTQGGEKSMLMNFPFDKVRVNYMLIEYYKRGPSPKLQDDELVSYLNSKGFDLIYMFKNMGEYIFKFRQ